MVGYLYASRLLITSLGSGLGPSRLGLTVTSLGSWPPAQPTRTHDHVPRLRASGPADSDPKSRPSAPGLGPSRLGLTRHPKSRPSAPGLGPSRLGLTRHPLTPAQIGHVMLGDTGTRPLPAAPPGGIPRSRLGLACLWRTPHSPPRLLGLFAPRRAARGSQRAATADPVEPGPGPSRPPRFSRRSAYDQSFKGIRPLLAGTWRTWCELRGRRHASTPASLPTPASPPVSRQDGLMRAWLSPACGVDLVPSPTSFPPRAGMAWFGTVSARLEGRTTSHHPTHTICRRPVGGLGWVQLPRAAHLIRSCARQDGLPLLPATSGTPWKARVRIAAAAGLPGAVALELVAGK